MGDFTLASLLLVLAYSPISAQAQVLSPPKIPGNNPIALSITDWASVSNIQDGINQARRA